MSNPLDVTRLPAYMQDSMDAELPGYDSPTTRHDTVASTSLDPLTILLLAEEEDGGDSWFMPDDLS